MDKKRNSRSHYKIVNNELIPKKAYETELDAVTMARFLNSRENVIHKMVAYKCSKCNKWHIVSYNIAKLFYKKVIGSEIVAPLGDAVRLVHRNHADLSLFDFCYKKFSAKTFRGNVQKLVAAKYAVVQSQENILPSHSGIDGGSLYPATAQVGYLILHQSYERCYY